MNKSQVKKSKTIIETFIELMDNLFYEGYAMELAADNPAAFNFEYNQFFNNYN